MSCGGKTCTSIEALRHAEIVKQPSWLLRIWRIIDVAIDKMRRHRIRLELEKACQCGLLKHLDDDQLKDLGLTREQVDWAARKPLWK